MKLLNYKTKEVIVEKKNCNSVNDLLFKASVARKNITFLSLVDELIENLNFVKKNFYRSEFFNCQFVGINFNHCNLKNVKFINCTFINCVFEKCLMYNSSFSSCEEIGCEFITNKTCNIYITDSNIESKICNSIIDDSLQSITADADNNKAESEVKNVAC